MQKSPVALATGQAEVMQTSGRGRALIKSFESCRLYAYQDGGGVWTQGWGHVGPDIYPGIIWTQAHADDVFNDDLRTFEEGVTELLRVSVTQEQFDALVSLAYNIGLDIDKDTNAEGLGDSTLLRMLNAGDVEGAAKQFKRWNKDNGKIIAGLTRRRKAEELLFRSEA